MNAVPRVSVPAAVGVVVLLVAGWDVWVPGLWYDEVATLVAADRSWSSLSRMLTEVDAVHGAYYSLMHVWVDALGTSPLALRAPSVIAVAGTAAVLAAFSQAQWGQVAGIVAGLASVAIPRLHWMATESRSYALATFLTTLAVVLFWRALHRNGRVWWRAYAVTLAISIWVFMYSILVIPALFLSARLSPRWEKDQRRPFWVSTAVAALAGSPVIFIAASQRGQLSWIEPLTISSVWQQPLGAFLGGKTDVAHAVLWVAFLALCAVLWGLTAMRRGSNEVGLYALVLGWLTIPVLLLLAMSFVIPLWSPRYASISAPALALLVAGAVAALGGRAWHATLTAFILVALAAQSWIGWRLPEAKGVTLRVVELVERDRGPRDAIWFARLEGGSARYFMYAYPEAFAGAVDISLDRPYEISGGLWETSRPLKELGETGLSVFDRVIGVTQESSLDHSVDLEYLRTAGFAEVKRESAGPWVVVVLVRR